MSIIYLFTSKLLLGPLNHVFLYIVVINLVSDISSANSCCLKSVQDTNEP